MKLELKKTNKVGPGDLFLLGDSTYRLLIASRDGEYAFLDLETGRETCHSKYKYDLINANNAVLIAKGEDLVLTIKK